MQELRRRNGGRRVLVPATVEGVTGEEELSRPSGTAESMQWYQCQMDDVWEIHAVLR